MERVDVEAADAATAGGVERRTLGEALDTAEVAINHYRLAAGERLAGLHAHADQEEAFLVLSGAVVFETLDGRVPVAEGEAVRFPPGEFQSCTNPGDREAAVLALGAPKDSDDLRVPVGCSACGGGEHRLGFDEGKERLTCPSCGAETGPDCPDCGGDDLRVVLGSESRPVERCRDCGSTTPAR